MRRGGGEEEEERRGEEDRKRRGGEYLEVHEGGVDPAALGPGTARLPFGSARSPDLPHLGEGGGEGGRVKE